MLEIQYTSDKRKEGRKKKKERRKKERKKKETKKTERENRKKGGRIFALLWLEVPFSLIKK